MLLLELFQTAKTPVKWKGDTAYFTIDDTEYMLFFAAVTEGDVWHGPIKDHQELKPVNGKSFFIGFMASDKNNTLTDQAMGGKNSIKVFSVVIQEMQKWAAKKKPKMIYFGSDSTVPSRMSLYKKFVQRFTKDSDWFVVGEADADYMGPKHMWVLKKKD